MWRTKKQDKSQEIPGVVVQTYYENKSSASENISQTQWLKLKIFFSGIFWNISQIP